MKKKRVTYDNSQLKIQWIDKNKSSQTNPKTDPLPVKDS